MAAFLLPLLRLEPEKRATAAEALQHPWLSDVDESATIPRPIPAKAV